MGPHKATEFSPAAPFIKANPLIVTQCTDFFSPAAPFTRTNPLIVTQYTQKFSPAAPLKQAIRYCIAPNMARYAGPPPSCVRFRLHRNPVFISGKSERFQRL